MKCQSLPVTSQRILSTSASELDSVLGTDSAAADRMSVPAAAATDATDSAAQAVAHVAVDVVAASRACDRLAVVSADGFGNN